MHSKISKFAAILCVCTITGAPMAFAQVNRPPATASNCASIASCSTPQQDTRAFKDVDVGFVKKLKEVAKAIVSAIDDMDAQVTKAIMTYSLSEANSLKTMSDSLNKNADAEMSVKQQFLQERTTFKALQVATPSTLLKEDSTLKIQWPTTEFLTRAIRQRLYHDQVQRVELEHEQFYSDKTNKRARAYSQGTIAGIAKLYETHRKFFCNAAGANKPPGCGEDIASQGVTMGDQMFEVFLGDGTWPKSQVQKAIELMQFYLGISPPDLPNTSDFSTGEGQRAYMAYQGKLARNNILTYILSWLAARRAPTNEGQASFIQVRKDAAGCDVITDQNGAVCEFLDKELEKGSSASMATLDRSLNYDRYMNSGFMKKAIDGTMGIDKDITVMMADRLKQDYDEYQMDMMITGAMAGYYAGLVNNKR